MAGEDMADGMDRDPPTPIVAVHAAALERVLAACGEAGRAYARACDFKAEPGQVLLVPGNDGAATRVLFGVEAPPAKRRDRLLAGKLAPALPLSNPYEALLASEVADLSDVSGGPSPDR